MQNLFHELLVWLILGGSMDLLGYEMAFNLLSLSNSENTIFLLIHTYSMHIPAHVGIIASQPLWCSIKIPTANHSKNMIFGLRIDTNPLLLDCAHLRCLDVVSVWHIVSCKRVFFHDSYSCHVANQQIANGSQERLLAYCFCKGGWFPPENLTWGRVNPAVGFCTDIYIYDILYYIVRIL